MELTLPGPPLPKVSKTPRAPSFQSDDSEFQDWLQGSGELQVMLSNDGSATPFCPRHPDRRIVAACTRCSALLCKHCLDRIEDEFVCSACVTDVITEGEDGGGLVGWFRRLFNR